MSDALAVFAKAPLPGSVKTRLSPPLRADEAAAVYEASLEVVVATAQRARAEVVLLFDPAHEGEGYFASAFPGTVRLAQRGEGLGERLANGFDTLFAREHERVAIIGADSPTLPAARLADAFAELRRTDAVLGPTHDGGYYLVGLTRRSWPVARALFAGIAWSTEAVLAETLERAGRAGIRVSMLPDWYDIDRPDDLERAARDAEPDSRLGRLLERWAVPARGDRG